jgi:WD40 repeat protein
LTSPARSCRRWPIITWIPGIDWKSIPKGEDWEQEIYRGIEEADAFLFLISPDSVASQMCNKEIAHAVKNGKRILPIVIRDADPKNIHPEISKRNWIFCRDGQGDFNKAIEEAHETIHIDYEWLKYHTELQVKALKWEQKKDASRLLRGKELREAEQKLAELGNQEDPQATKLQREYILASRRNKERQRRQITIGLSLGLVMMAALSIFAWIQRNEAQHQARIALTRQLSAQAQSLFATGNSKQITAVLLAIQSMRLFPAKESSEILQNNTLAFPIARIMGDWYVSSVAFSPDGRYVVSGGNDSTARVWEASTGQEIARMTHDGYVSVAAFSPDGKHVVSGGWDYSARVWEMNTGKEIARMTHDNYVSLLAFKPDGKYVVSGSWDGTARVWEASTGREIARMTHDEYVSSLAFSSDGKYVVSGSWDDTARVWEASTGGEIARMTHDNNVSSLTFSPDGKYVVSGSLDDTARVWIYRPDDLIDSACSRVTRNLTRAEWKLYIGDTMPYQAVCPNLPIEPEARSYNHTNAINRSHETNAGAGYMACTILLSAYLFMINFIHDNIHIIPYGDRPRSS